MGADTYANIASIMRYFFVGIVLFIIASVLVRSIIEGSRNSKARQRAGLSVRFIEILAPEAYKGKCFSCMDDIVIGASQDCDVALPNTKLGQKHAYIYTDRGRVYFRTNQRSFSELNGVKPNRTSILTDGDTVWIKDVCFVCRKNKAELEESANE